MAELETPDALRDDLRTAWHRYIDMLVPLRPALYGYLSPPGRKRLGHRGPGSGRVAAGLRALGRHLPGNPRPPRLSAAHGDERLDRHAAPPRHRGPSPHGEPGRRPGLGHEP